MHIPDGFVAPQIYLPAYILDISLLAYSIRRIKRSLNERAIPYLSSVSLLSFVISSITIPLPGGTSVHGTGIPILSILFGPWVAFVSYSLILFLQAVLFGEGGITTFPINSISMGFVGSFAAFFTYKALSIFKEEVSIVISSFVSIMLSALLIATILGIHPYLFKKADGSPLYFPFGLYITIPAVIVPHIFVGLGEGLLSSIAIKVLNRRLKVEG
jgi:cobalt/nickel transport system permease protein